jgi:hypothetical protein
VPAGATLARLLLEDVRLPADDVVAHEAAELVNDLRMGDVLGQRVAVEVAVVVDDGGVVWLVLGLDHLDHCLAPDQRSLFLGVEIERSDEPILLEELHLVRGQPEGRGFVHAFSHLDLLPSKVCTR